MTPETAALQTQIFALLSTVPDPEIPVLSLTDLGIIRALRPGATPGAPAELVITPTYSGCPAATTIQRDIRHALDTAGLAAIKITTELSPAWTTDWISEAGRRKLHAYGIAPPETAAQRSQHQHDAPALCPQCGSAHTQQISRFGATPCKALWRCLDCAEPFDRFKCL
jgi:ring-1,2-phenylacetyl-CoA epoxidase subunit PaaD